MWNKGFLFYLSRKAVNVMKDKIEYVVIKKTNTEKDMMEKNFCFGCGCFQGGVNRPLIV